MRYIPNTMQDQQEMLASIGVSDLEALFRDIPQEIRARFRPIGLEPQSEMEVAETVRSMADRNEAAARVSFLGGGIYDHYVPSIVTHLLSRSEFYTAYTPYQPEISQGTLTAMFEFQTLVCELTGMEIANASMYDGSTALAEAVLMAVRLRKQSRIAVAASLFTQVTRVLETYCWAADIEIVELPYDERGYTILEDLPADISAVALQTPNAFGIVEPLSGIKERIGDALLIVSANPLSLALLEPPASFGADIVVAEGQPLGLSMGFGGPLLGLFATRKAYMRQMPGRMAGRTIDAEANVGYTMAAQTREQHIRRERATSNICTNAALCALAATIYMASAGAQGLRHVAALNLARAHHLADRLTALDGFDLAFGGGFFNEFVLRIPGRAEAVHSALEGAGFLVETPSALRAYGLEDCLRFAVTEKRTQEEMDRVEEIVGGVR